jgi:SAM-dependent methyltransferase
MKDTSAVVSQYAADRAETLRNREKLSANVNLRYWYAQLYREQFREFPDPRNLAILEIGSGVSPLRRFYSNVITTDVLELDYLDYVFDCHEIDQQSAIVDQSLDVITLTNVLHHLKRPLDFLNRAATKLKPGGKIIATEPYFSVLSTLIFEYLHHERVDFSITRPELMQVHGPLASANIALPWLIFVRNQDWRECLYKNFHFNETTLRPFSSVSYMATGGISHRIPVPTPIYRALFHLDMLFSRAFPKVFASFFTITLTRN